MVIQTRSQSVTEDNNILTRHTFFSFLRNELSAYHKLVENGVGEMAIVIQFLKMFKSVDEHLHLLLQEDGSIRTPYIKFVNVIYKKTYYIESQLNEFIRPVFRERLDRMHIRQLMHICYHIREELANLCYK